MIKYLKVRCGSQENFIEFETKIGRDDLLAVTTISGSGKSSKKNTIVLFKKEAREFSQLLLAASQL